MFPTISLGPLVLPTIGVVYLAGLWFSLNQVERAARLLQLKVEAVYGLAVIGLMTGLIGGRLLFVGEYWAAFQENLISIIWPLNNGYNLWGGLFFGLAAAFFYGRYKSLPLAATLDALAPGLVVVLLALSLADFLAGPGYGTLSNVPWSISVFGLSRHPVQLYEIVLGLLALLLWWRVARQRTFPGQLFLLTVFFYSAGRLFLDAFRDNSPLVADGYRLIQLAAFAAMMGSLFLLARFSLRLAEEP
jgi:phosphatidylglycerol---prolipoprotein diacylglyceryl transferase